MKIILMFLLLIPAYTYALEVDEKLTVRILKTSETRKTVLINRGTEDGLVEGDHARFMVTAGIVARGMVVKVSPTRSVWSIYRLVNADYIVNDSVMTIKITPPVKVTKDDSQSLIREDVPVRTTPDSPPVGIPLADGANDLQGGGIDDDEDLRALSESGTARSLVERNMEVIGIVNISSLSSTSSADGQDDSSGSLAQYHIGATFEYYPQNERAWYSRFSLLGSLNLIKSDAQSYNGFNAKNDYTEFGLGVNWHPTKLPSQVGEFVPFLTVSMGYGQVKSTAEGSAQEMSATGTGNSFAIGGGYKFYARNGFGARFILDYYLRNESFDEDDETNQYTRAVSGPRLQVGLSYRF